MSRAKIVAPARTTLVFMVEAPMSIRATASPRSSGKLSSNWLASAKPSTSTMDGVNPASETTEAYSSTLDFLTATRSEEHTSELQSLAYLVCRLLLEKKKINSPRRRETSRGVSV